MYCWLCEGNVLWILKVYSALALNNNAKVRSSFAAPRLENTCGVCCSDGEL